ncbi:hypothetical protein NOM01_13955, partial [Sporolactobacillus sp. STSJ-5]|uniref:hypothetical protein n=1 Tax=Sporolactobacillus sp. STSJ-5 TaxID=2965076 RepID=UPI002104777A
WLRKRLCIKREDARRLRDSEPRETPQIPACLRRLSDRPRQASNRSVHKNQDGLRTKRGLDFLTS